MHNNPNTTQPERRSEGRKTLRQIVKYASVSFTQTFMELGVFSLLRVFIGFSAANVIAVVYSAAYQFLMNRNITFKSSSNFTRSATLFILMWVWNLVFSTFAISFASTTLGWNESLTKLITMGCQAIWGFLLSKYVIFK